MHTPTRRTLMATGGAAALGGALTACSGGLGGFGGGGDGDTTTILYGWWGSPEKDEALFAAIDAFNAANPDVVVEGESTPWEGYWDKLATMSAGGDAPDVIHMSERYILEYGERDALLDLRSDDALDLSALDETVVALGESGDSTLYAVPAGLNTFVLAVNVGLFEEAGVEVPDDTTWTWDDYYAASQAIEDAGFVGSNYGSGIESFRPWLHQHGETMYTEDCTAAGFDEATLSSYLDHLLTLRESGGQTADQVSEGAGMPIESSPFANGQVGMTWMYSNQLGEIAAVDDSDMKLMRIPSQAGQASEAGMYYKGSEFYSISAHSDEDQQAAAIRFVDFMVNDPEALELAGMIMGVPPNTDAVEQTESDPGEMDQHVLEFVTDLADDLTVESPGPSPIGSGNIQGIFDRECLELLYDRITVEEATSNIFSSINSELG